MIALSTRKAIKDFRSAIEDAEAAGELIRITREVDPLIEIPAIVRGLANMPRIPLLLFENIAGYENVRCAGAVFGDPQRVSRFMGFEGLKGMDKWNYLPILDNPIEPKLVSSGPCKENVITENIDIEKLVPPTHGALKVKHRYYQPVVLAKHPVTGAVNTAVYRASIQGKDRITVNFRWDQHGGLLLSAAKAIGATVPVAVCIGTSPAVYSAATSKVPYGFEEMDLAGGILGEPVEMVKCETIDLEVPASSEIVIEGEIRPPYEKGSEGPWPEYLGYLGMNIQPPVMQITAVTFRDNPINNMIVPGTVPHILGMPAGAALIRHLRGLVGEFVVDAAITGSSRLHHAIVKVKKTEAHHEGLQINAAMSCFGYTNTIDQVTLVDEDIDIYNLAQVDWAVASRCNPAKQVHLLPEGRTHQNNPIAGVRETIGEPINKGKMIVDATIPWNFKVTEKGPGLTFFTKSEWPQVDLKDYFDPADRSKWLK